MNIRYHREMFTPVTDSPYRLSNDWVLMNLMKESFRNIVGKEIKHYVGLQFIITPLHLKLPQYKAVFW